jgi:insulysin
MFVGSGSLNDPPEIEGMAHFCEHMLFLGSEKYPEANYYQAFISEHGGDSNAATGEEYTYFYHNVNPDNFEESLDIFSRFFVDPLFNEELAQKEISAIESEFQLNLNEEAMATD